MNDANDDDAKAPAPAEVAAEGSPAKKTKAKAQPVAVAAADDPRDDEDDEDEDEDEEDEEEEPAPPAKPKRVAKRKQAKKPRPIWPYALAAVAIITSTTLYLYKSEVPLPRGVTAKQVPSATVESWVERGYLELEPPLRLPTRADGKGRIGVFVKFPDTGKITVRHIDAQKRDALVFPVGTIADRLEIHGDPPRIVDVRGTELAPDGEIFHVYRKHGEGLRGFFWKRDDAEAQTAADVIVVNHARKNEGAARDNFESLRVNNACGPCHAHARETFLTEKHRGPQRGTDASGFFLPETVLHDSVPVEHHRAREMNIDDKFIKFHCPGPDGTVVEPPLAEHKDGTKWPDCADPKVNAYGTLDLAAALAAGDEHAKKVCASRQILFDHMDDAARKAFADAFKTCHVGG